MPTPVHPERLELALTLLRDAGERGITKQALCQGLTLDGDLDTVSGKTAERCVARLEEDGAEVLRAKRGGRRVYILQEAPPWDDHVSAAARLALKMASSVLCQSGTLLWEEQLAFIGKVASGHMSDSDRRLFRELEKSVQVSGGAEDSVEGPADETLGPILAALAQSRQIRVEYLAAGRTSPLLHEVVPVGLTHDLFSGGSYLLTWSPVRRQITPLRLNRIVKVEVLPRLGVVEPPEPAARAGKYAIGGWFSTDEPFEVLVRIRNSGWVQALRDCPPALPDCACTPERGGRALLVRFKANRQEGALRWVLQFGEHAEVLAPAGLREALRKKLEKTLKAYQA
jgi:proteasome accessory factor B